MTMEKMDFLKQDAVRKGPIYCAPWCGGKCTRKAFELATKEAARLCAKLGAGWTPRVWENLGWHTSVRSPCGRLVVHINITGSPILGNWKPSGYTAYLGSKTNMNSNRWSESAKTPAGAIRGVLEQARAEISTLQSYVEGL